MKTELNNTGIKLADLNETEIKLAIELYKLAGSKIDDDPDTLFRNDDARVIGDFDGIIGYFYGDDKRFITLHQLAFESGLNPDWADEIVHTGANLFWYGDNQGKPFSKGMCSHGNSEILIKKHTESKEPKPQSDQVKNPSHYQFFDGVEVIEIIAKSLTVEQFKGYCLANRLKYRLRAGNKDNLEQDIAKSDFYVQLYEKHKHLCR